MSLIARFVFDTGNPVDIRINSDQKEEFLEKMKKGEFFYDNKGEGVFHANLSHARFFFVNEAAVEQPNDAAECEEAVAESCGCEEKQ